MTAARGAAAPPAFARALAAQQAGRTSEAIAAYQEALEAEPALAPAHFNLGQLLRLEGREREAADRFAQAVRLRPTAADAWLNLGLCRERLDDLAAAADAYQRSATLSPDDGTAQFNLGNVLRKQGRNADALRCYRAAARLHPASAEVQLNLGNTLRELGDLDPAIDALRAALALRPTWTEARWNLALALLGSGRLREGWELYDLRWEHLGLPLHRDLPWPTWQGQALSGRRILVWREQGLGDELLFSSCVPDLVQLGARVTLAVDRRLVSLLQRALPEVRVVADPEWGDQGFDFHTPLGSLPRYVRASRAAFVPGWSLLLPDRGLATRWRERVQSLGGRLRVGICWRSGVRTPDRARHYASLSQYAPVLRVPGITWVSLQYDDAAAELAAVESELGVSINRWPDVDLRDDLESVAALIWNLDLVVTASTAISPLAGALGTETWQVDSGTDWTALGETRSPWLPAIRLFRQRGEAPGWEPTIAEVAEALRGRLADRPVRPN